MSFIKQVEALVSNQNETVKRQVLTLQSLMTNAAFTRELERDQDYYLDALTTQIKEANAGRRNIFLVQCITIAMEYRLASIQECAGIRRTMSNFGFSPEETGNVLGQLILQFQIDPASKDLPTVAAIVLAGKRRTSFNSVMWFVGLLAGGLTVHRDRLVEEY